MRLVLLEHLDNPRARRRWAAALGESELARIVFLIDRSGARPLLDAAEILFAAWASATEPYAATATRRTAFWIFFLAFIAATNEADRSIERLTQFFLAHVRGQGSAEGQRRDDDEAVDKVRAVARRLAGNAGNAAVLAALAHDRRQPPAHPASRPARPPQVLQDKTATQRQARERPTSNPSRHQPSSSRTAFSYSREEPLVEGEPIYITNAGLVLTTPFLPRLFQSLDMVESTEQGRPRIRPAQLSRAVHLLQWLADGRTSAPEPLLCLNKLLCGVPIATPVEVGIDPTPLELQMGTALLRSLLANWARIQNTSIAGLRETFLQRDGRLERVAHGWRLQIQRRTVDILLQDVPWSISTVVHSLMPEPIFVNW